MGEPQADQSAWLQEISTGCYQRGRRGRTEWRVGAACPRLGETHAMRAQLPIGSIVAGYRIVELMTSVANTSLRDRASRRLTRPSRAASARPAA
jgi:hypothetical protein